jgi:hypothetical protein
MDNMTSEEIKYELNAVSRQLNSHRTDVAMLERLKTAQKETTRLQNEMDRLTAAFAEAQAAEDKAAKQQLADSIKDMRITFATKSVGGGIMNGSFTISYKRLAFDGETNTTVWRTQIVEGFRALEPSIMQYLLEQSPESLPPEITSLVPGDHYAAMNAYMLGLRRGHISL